MVPRPSRNSSRGSLSEYLASESLSDTTGVTVFIISCMSTRISLVHDSVSISLCSLLMSLKEIIATCFPPIVADEDLRAIERRDMSLVKAALASLPPADRKKASESSGLMLPSCLRLTSEDIPRMRSAAALE